MKCSVSISNLLKRSLVFPILLFSFISLHWLLRKAFLSLLAILWNSAFKWVYTSFSPLPFTSVLFSAICKASSDNHFAFLHFFQSHWIFIIFNFYHEPLFHMNTLGEKYTFWLIETGDNLCCSLFWNALPSLCKSCLSLGPIWVLL